MRDDRKFIPAWLFSNNSTPHRPRAPRNEILHCQRTYSKTTTVIAIAVSLAKYAPLPALRVWEVLLDRDLLFCSPASLSKSFPYPHYRQKLHRKRVRLEHMMKVGRCYGDYEMTKSSCNFEDSVYPVSRMFDYRPLLRSSEPALYLDSPDVEEFEKTPAHPTVFGLHRKKSFLCIGFSFSILANLVLATLLTFAVASQHGNCTSGADVFYC